MKKFARLVCAVLVLGLLLTACSAQSSQSGQPDAAKTNFSDDMADAVVTDSGVYYGETLSDTPRLMYYDFATGLTVPLCSNPQCTHQDANTCNAIFDGGLYGLTLNSTKNCLQGMTFQTSSVYSIKLDGSSRDKIGDLGLISAAGKDVHYTGTYKMDEDTLFYTVFKKDGSVSLYRLPLYKSATPTEIYNAAASTLSGYSVIMQIWPLATCENSLFFLEDSVVTVPDGVTEEELGRPYRVSCIKYFNAATNDVQIIAENYSSMAQYGSKYLLVGEAGIATWDPASGELEELTRPKEVAELLELESSKGSTVSYGKIYYDEKSDFYYLNYSVYENSDSLTAQNYIFVLDNTLKVTNTIICGDYDALLWSSDKLVALKNILVDNKYEVDIYTLPKSELENQTEITWDFENVLK